jgi:hypothetical protein
VIMPETGVQANWGVRVACWAGAGWIYVKYALVVSLVSIAAIASMSTLSHGRKKAACAVLNEDGNAGESAYNPATKTCYKWGDEELPPWF